MKKVAIFSNNLQLGGVQKSLINLLNLIHDKWEVHLYLLDKDNELLPFVPSDVLVDTIGYPLRMMGISHSAAKQEGVARGIQSFLLRAITRVFGKRFVVPCMVGCTKSIDEEFDVAISYVHDGGDKSFYGGCNEFVLRRVKAKRKLSFMHGDFVKCGSNTAYNIKILLRFDKIICVSRYCSDSMKKAVPEMAKKITFVPNIINYDEIIRLASEDSVIYSDSDLNMVTVARLSREKGLTRVVPILKQAINRGIKVKWFIIGDGAYRNELCTEIEKYDLKDYVIIKGKQTNPYKFIYNADLFLLPSYEEAEGMVIKEALGIGVPVCATDTGATRDILPDDYGFICQNFDDDLNTCLQEIFDNPKRLEEKKVNLKGYRPNNLDSENRIRALIEGCYETN